MIEIFADASYWIALQIPSDALHPAAVELAQILGQTRRIVTSELVLVEFLDHASRYGSHLRKQAAATWNDIRTDPSCIVLPATSSLLTDAHKLYMNTLDKSWSHTDCTSFIIMKNRSITGALTYDRHFEQAGFEALLRTK